MVTIRHDMPIEGTTARFPIRLRNTRNPEAAPSPAPEQPPSPYNYYNCTAGGGGNHALQDYQMQLMLLEQQNKKRAMMQRQDKEAAEKGGLPTVYFGSSPEALRGSAYHGGVGAHNPDERSRHQMMQTLLAQQQAQYQAQQLAMARQQEAVAGRAGQHAEDLARQDYQMQLMLLEQQNKKRLMMARQEHDAAEMNRQRGEDVPRQDYQMQLMLLEQQNKKRLLMARGEANVQLATPNTSDFDMAGYEAPPPDGWYKGNVDTISCREYYVIPEMNAANWYEAGYLKLEGLDKKPREFARQETQPPHKVNFTTDPVRDFEEQVDAAFGPEVNTEL